MSQNGGRRRRKSGSKQKRSHSPACAKIWEFIYNLGGDYEQYATNIMDICARDTMSDYRGLTVIIPNPEFREAFHSKIHGSHGSISAAKRMLRNTIIKRWLDSSSDFNKNDYQETLPIASGLTLPVVKVDGDVVTLADGVKIKRRDDFDCPSAFNYSIWEVISGNYSTDTSFETSRSRDRTSKGGDGSSSKSKTISGGSKSKFIVNIGKRLKNSSDARRIGMIASIISQYRATFTSSREQVNPLLEKGTSLYNWLFMYAPDVYQHCLIVTDIHPGINMLMLILDPHSPITDELLFGDPGARNVEGRNGWNGSSVTTNSHIEWAEHLDRAAKWTKSERGYLKSVQRIRKSFTGKRGHDIRSLVMAYYNDPIPFIKEHIDPNASSVLTSLQDWYGPSEYKYRKLWQDEFRLVALYGFTTLATVKFTAVDETDDIFRNMVTFRPYENTKYDQAASFSYEGGNYQSKENDFLLSKFFMSTNLGYMPSSCSDESSICAYPGDKSGLSSKLDGPVSASNVCNCHRIKCELFSQMKGVSKVNPELYYGLQWQLKQRDGGGADTRDIEGLFDKVAMSGDKGGSAQFGGDPYEIRGGKGLRTSESEQKRKKKRELLQAASSRRDDDSDNSDNQLGDLAELQLFVAPEGIKEELISSEEEVSVESEGSEDEHRRRHRKSGSRHRRRR